MRSRLPREFLIVGGGPAGTSAAITLGEAGRDVILVERTAYTEPRVGESLPPAANPVLDRLGLDPDALGACGTRCPGSASAWGEEQPHWNDSMFDPDGDGLHLDRAAFDRLLAARALTAGAEVNTGHSVMSCRRVGRAWLVTISGPDGIREVVASTLIDASGRMSWPGRPTRREAFDRQVAVVGLHELGKDARLDRRTWVESARDGWWYSAALPGGLLVAAYFTDSDLLDAPKGRRAGRFSELLSQTRWTRERLGGARPLGHLRVVAATSTIATPIAGDCWVAVGDAASTIDPLSSQGILHAITSGRNAADALSDPDRVGALARYAQVITARFRADLATRAYFCRREHRWPDSPFWQRRTDPAAVPGPAILGLLSDRIAGRDKVD
jgi:flavin-dependent dehydrogenase